MNRRTPGGPVDQALPMLRAADPDGTIRAILVNYACHCTTLDPADNLISGDWAGDAQAAIEQDHPGATAMVLIGCGADANPKDRVSREAARRHGLSIAEEVNRLLEGELTPLPAAPPTGRLRRVEVPFDTLPTREELQALVKAGGASGLQRPDPTRPARSRGTASERAGLPRPDVAVRRQAPDGLSRR